MVLEMFVFSPFNHMTRLVARESFNIESIFQGTMLMQDIPDVLRVS
jgi:hypothetical protein